MLMLRQGLRLCVLRSDWLISQTYGHRSVNIEVRHWKISSLQFPTKLDYYVMLFFIQALCTEIWVKELFPLLNSRVGRIQIKFADSYTQLS